jgi:4-hydroxy-tetrahydrodipicolinate reductase
MPECFHILQVGFGSLGRHIALSILQRENLRLVGLVDAAPNLAGAELEDQFTEDVKTNLKIEGDLQEALDRLHDSPADVAIVATSSSLVSVAPLIEACLARNMDVLSICEELSYPYNRHPQLSSKIDEAATQFGKTVLGTGINPGYLMDLLPIVLTAPCQRVAKIHVTRNMNSSRRRPSFQKKIGTGMSKEEFRTKIDEGDITGHVGLVESIRMIDAALNLGLDDVKELPPEAVLAEETITNPFTTIERGHVLGLKSTALGSHEGQLMVQLDFLAFAEAKPEYDEVLIEGHPRIHQRIEGGVQGDSGTVGMILNLIPLVVRASPGLKTMKDISVPRNTSRFYKDSELR